MKTTIFRATIILLFFYCFVSAMDAEEMAGKLKDKKNRESVAAEIERSGKSAVKPLREIAKDKRRHRDARIASILLLGRLKTREARADMETLLATDDDNFCREASAIALGDLGDKKAITALKEGMRDKSVNVRMRSVRALAKLGDLSGRDLALKTLTKESDVTGKLLASDALQEIGDKSVIPELESHLNDSNIWTKIYAKLAIKKIGMAGLAEDAQIAYLKESLKDTQSEVDQWAAITLAKIGKSKAIGVLVESSKDKNLPGNYAARKVLEKLVERGKLTKEEIQ